uniref:ABC-2 type transport system permease protein n=1 Tax=uncultured Chloroflexota bacterium TaxID=166587 RepID=H5SBD7_9CHLR|nr:ABC-2 type transport system permease protein [uncultured Chloroflexota bacterium]BAL55913.1 ABC-2 type transport system permease protein [uncultured Chloroflexota bacterium]
MRRNIFLHEFRWRLPSALIWGFSTAAVILIYLIMFPLFADQAEVVHRAFQQFPREFRAAFGIGDVDFSTVMGFFTFVYLFVQLLLALQASNYGFGMLSVEEREWTADFLMSKPVARGEIFFSKLAAALCDLAFTQAIVWATAFGAIEAFRAGRPYDARLLTYLLLGLPPFQLVFFSLGILISLLVRRIRNVTPYGLGLGFGMYLLGAFSDLLGEAWLEYLTPFKHFNSQYALTHGHFDGRLLSLSLVISTLALIFSYLRYLRRDIPSAT